MQVSCLSGCLCCQGLQSTHPDSCVIDAAAAPGSRASLQRLHKVTVSQHTACRVRLHTLGGGNNGSNNGSSSSAEARGAGGGGGKFKLVSVLVRVVDGPPVHTILRKHHRPGAGG